MTLALQEKSQTFAPPLLSPASPRSIVRLLGEPSVKLGCTWQPFIADRRYQVLAYLAHAGTWVSRDTLADLFYGDTNQSAARSNLRKILFKVKNLEWLEGLEQNDEALRWQTDTDVTKFQKACKEQQWEKAVHCYTGSFLQGFNNDDTDFHVWLEAERLRLEELYQYAAEKYVETLETRGDLETALFFLRSMLGRDPLLESLHRQVIRLEFKRGNTEAAFEQFECCREVLQKELGVEPEPETLELLRRLEEGTAQAKYAVLLNDPEAVPDAPQTLFGREKLLQEISRLLHQGKRVLLQGFGGMGKTAVAATVAKTFLKGQKKGVLWLQVGADNPEVVLEALARPFDAVQDLAKAENKTAFLAEVFKKQKLSLVVLDDVWNAYSLSKVSEALPPGLPLLVTSRQRYSRLERVYVDRLERVASLDLLAWYAEPPLDKRRENGFTSPNRGGVAERRGGSNTDRNKLCELLGDHPFALRIAGLNLRETSTSELLERIKNTPHDLKIPDDFKEAGRESVAALLSVSLETLSDLEYELFLSYGILATPSATPGFLACCTQRNLNQVENALFTLVERGLAVRVSKPESDLVAYRLHDLAHSYARANRIQRPSTLVRAALEHLREHKNDVELLELDSANVLEAARRCQEQKREEDFVTLVYLLTVEGTYYTARGHTTQSLVLLEAAANLAEKNNKGVEAHFLYTKLGEHHFSFTKNYALALNCYNKARELAVTLKNKSRQAILLGLMAIARFHQGEFDVDELSRKAYALAKETGDDECLAQVLGQLGCLAGFKGDMRRARSVLYETLEVLTRLSSSTPTSTVDIGTERFFTLLNLGETEYQVGRFEEGLSARQQALELAKTHNNEIWMGYAHYEIGEMFYNQNCFETARQHMTCALELFERNHALRDVEATLKFLQASSDSAQNQSYHVLVLSQCDTGVTLEMS
jgi:DNA-binding SARP family transcriptional activator